MFNALAQGRARVDGFLDAADTRSTIAAMRALGAMIEEQGDGTLIVEGRGRAGLTEPSDVLDCGNAGTSMRLLAGVVAGLPGLYVLTGDDSLRGRTMARIVRPLNELGARVTARAEGTLPPLVIEGSRIAGGQRLETAMASAQVKSAILLAGLAADGPTTVIQPEQTRDHTERLLSAMGAGIDASGSTVTMTPRMFVATFLQYNSAANVVGVNTRFRWEYRPGSDFFFVYSEGRDTLVSGFPGLTNRQLVAKFTRLFRF